MAQRWYCLEVKLGPSKEQWKIYLNNTISKGAVTDMQKNNDAVPVTILCIAPILHLIYSYTFGLYGAKSIDAENSVEALFPFCYSAM